MYVLQLYIRGASEGPKDANEVLQLYVCVAALYSLTYANVC